MVASKSITFINIVVLKQLYEFNKRGIIPPATVLTEIVNEYISWHNIPESHVTPITNRYRFQQEIQKLRGFRLLEPNGKYQITEEGKEFSIRIPDSWLEWPLYIPVTNGRIRYDKALHLEEY